MTQEALPGLDGVGVPGGGRNAADAPADPFAAAVPAWLRERLEELNPARRSADAKLVPCGRCGAPVLEAADLGLDLMADSRVDPAILDADAEVAALLGGRYTAELEVSRFGGGIRVFRRDRWLMPSPAGSRRRFAVPEHRCGAPLGVALPWQMVYPQVYQQHLTTSERGSNEPPF